MSFNTEHAANMAKDFDVHALDQIRDACRKRAEWCREESDRRHEAGGWSTDDMSDLDEDAKTYDRIAHELGELIDP